MVGRVVLGRRCGHGNPEGAAVAYARGKHELPRREHELFGIKVVRGLAARPAMCLLAVDETVCRGARWHSQHVEGADFVLDMLMEFWAKG